MTPKTRHRLITAAKITGWTLMGLVLLIVGSLMALVNILTPDRLTPIAEKLAEEYLYAKVHIEKAELTVWKTFPNLRVDVDGLEVLPTTLNDLSADERAELPAYADTLLTMRHFNGSVDMRTLLADRLVLRDIELTHPCVNMVDAGDGRTNYDIIRPSEKMKSSHGPSEVDINHFVINDPGPVRYWAEGSEITMLMKEVDVKGQDASSYQLHFSSDVEYEPLRDILDKSTVTVALDGRIDWKQTDPYNLGLKDFRFGLDFISGTISTDINFKNDLKISSLDLQLDPIAVATIKELVGKFTDGGMDGADFDDEFMPADDFGEEIADDFGEEITEDEGFLGGFDFNALDTDATIAIGIKLLKPWVFGEEFQLPDASITLDVPSCRAKYNEVDLDKVLFNGSLNVCSDLDGSNLTINNLVMQSYGMDLRLKGRVNDVLSDPDLEVEVTHASIDLTRLPEVLLNFLKGQFSGQIWAKILMRGKLSEIDGKTGLRNLDVEGDIKLDNVYYAAWDTTAMYYIDRGNLHFDSRRQAQSPLASLHADSVAILHHDVAISLSDLRADMATDTTVNLAATTFGVTKLTNGSGMASSGVTVRAVLHPGTKPAVDVDAIVADLNSGTRSTRIVFDDVHVSAALQYLDMPHSTDSPPKAVKKATGPHRLLPRDSIYSLALERHNLNSRHHPRLSEATDNGHEILILNVSRGFKHFLRDWSLSGSVYAPKGHIAAKTLPVRPTFSDIKLAFSDDSIVIRNLHGQVSHTDFTLTGRINRIKESMTDDMRTPLRIRLALNSDLIDLNELAGAVFAAEAARKASDKKPHPILIPDNIDVELDMKARAIRYADFGLHNYTGTLLASNGAVNLHNMRASSDVGSLTVDALYEGYNPDNLRFAFAMQLQNFNIGRFMSLVPATDSLMPLLRDIGGVINAEVAAGARLDSAMNIRIPSLDASIKIEGRNLSITDPHKLHPLERWMLFGNHHKDVIDHMTAQVLVKDSNIEIFPFIFDFDRFRLGVTGYNTIGHGFNYHIAVLKSPIHLRFGLDISRNDGKTRIHLGKTHFDPDGLTTRAAVAEDTRINLMHQIQNVFHRGLKQSDPPARTSDTTTDNG